MVQRPKFIDNLIRIPRIGRHLRFAHDAWLRADFYRHWESRNLHARQAFELDRPILTVAQRRVLVDLANRGVAHVHYNELFPDGQLWEILSSTVHQWISSSETKEKERAYKEGGHRASTWKEYIIRFYDSESTVSCDSPWLRLGLQPRILDIVNSYLGMRSKILGLDLWNTIPIAQRRQVTGSQRWHRDPEDIKLVKVFLYFTDVDLTAGPLHYVPNSRKGEKYGNLWPQRIPTGSVVPEDEFQRVVPSSDWEVCTGSPGTFIFVDTSGFHMGGRAICRNRVFATWAFVTPGSLWPRTFKLEGEVPRDLYAPAAFALST